MALKQYCPDCHIQLVRKKGYFECEVCNWSITTEEAKNGEGYSTLESTFDDELLYSNYESDIPEGCEACGGPYPDCMASCALFDD